MIIKIGWQDFQMRFLKQAKQVFVKEEEDEWCFYSYEGPFIIKSEVEKSDDSARNAAFVDRIITNPALVKVDEVDEQLEINFELKRVTKDDVQQ
jgi:hypothetical protein